MLIGSMVVLVLCCGAAYLYYGYLYKDSRNISEEKADFSIPASKLVSEYSNNQQRADSAYLNKTLEIKGKVTQVSDSIITLDSLVFCSFDQLPKTTGSKTVTIKGRCIGYDELFNEVKLDQCTIKE